MGRPRRLGPDDIVIEPNNYIRNLVVQRIPKDQLQDVQNTADSVHFPLPENVIGDYREWRAVSHTFVIQSNGDGLLTVLFERTV